MVKVQVKDTKNRNKQFQHIPVLYYQ